MELNLEYEVTKQDLTNAIKALPRMKTNNFVGIILIFLGVFLFVKGFLVGPENSSHFFDIIFILVGAFYLYLPYFSAGRSLKNLTPEERQVKFHLHEDGYHIRTGKGDHDYKWQAVHRVLEGKNVFLIYISEQFAHSIPKRILSMEDTETIRTLVKEHVIERKAPLRMKYPILVNVALLLLAMLTFIILYQFVKR
jgi:hypothetical protein